MNHTKNHINKIEISITGTIVNIPDIEFVACKTLLEKNRSGFAPHPFVKLNTRYIKSHPTTHT